MSQEQTDGAERGSTFLRDKLAAQLCSAGEALIQAGNQLLEVRRTLGEIEVARAARSQLAPKEEPTDPIGVERLQSLGESTPLRFPATAQPGPRRLSGQDLEEARLGGPGAHEPTPEETTTSELIDGLSGVDVQEVLARIEQRLRGLTAEDDEAPAETT